MEETLQHHSVQAKYPLINREKSILAFQERVLSLACDKRIPLLERLKFIAIVSTNLDEFFEVRMANIQEQIHAGLEIIGDETVDEWQKSIHSQVTTLIGNQYRLFADELVPSLEKEGVKLLSVSEWSDAQYSWLLELFVHNMLPVFTPIALDVAHPFPHIANKSLNFIVDLKGTDAYGRKIDIAVFSIPENLPHLIELPAEEGVKLFTTIQEVINAFIHQLFPDLTIMGFYQFRVTRNSHLFIDREELTNLHQALRGELKQRGFGHAVRLEIESNCPDTLKQTLLSEFDLKASDIYYVPHYFNLEHLFLLANKIDAPHLKYPKLKRYTPVRWLNRESAFLEIDKRDIILHHPYDSFTPVIDFLREAAEDPNVLVIRMTVYRTGDDSELMELLVKAARLGKEVNVVVELMARFDEKTNLQWASRLEDEGIKIVYGVFGYKTHAKMLLVIREEKNRHGEIYLRRYAHIGTGNYHSGNARLYTDFSLLTSDEEVTRNISGVFMNLSSLAKVPEHQMVWQAPFDFADRLLSAISKEEENIANGGEGRIIAKMNALLEPILIDALYEASKKGVQIDLVVRGACALKPGIKGLSENIRVRSIVGRFLEHSRVFYFYDNGAESVYLSSADWMNRNFFRRIEIAVPVLDPKVKRMVIKEGLMMYLDDHTAWILDGDSEQYHQKERRGKQMSVQEKLVALRKRDKDA